MALGSFLLPCESQFCSFFLRFIPGSIPSCPCGWKIWLHATNGMSCVGTRGVECNFAGPIACFGCGLLRHGPAGSRRW